MATQKRTDKIVEVRGMSVSGQDVKGLGKGQRYYVNLRLDYTKVSYEDAIELASGGSSVRVRAQTKLRPDTATLKRSGIIADSYTPEIQAKIDQLPWIEFDVSKDFEPEGRTPATPQQQGLRAFSKMNAEEKYLYLIEDMGFEEDVALARVQKDHPDFEG